MPDVHTLTTLRDLIIEGNGLLRRLEEMLLHERAALETRDLEQIEQTTSAKNQLLPQIEQNFAARQQALSACGTEPSAEGWLALIQALPTEPANALSADWQTLAESLERCQQLSQINQQLVHRSKENTDRLLSLLQGQGTQQDLYGRAGNRRNGGSQSRLGKA